ncbi:MAG: cyclic nucleotide-binding domain-containing protein [Betaproteobacteria bacterium]|nr:cyclic nucleotide-binding domain-containing protein [Betaproteobacteria bacterium]
MSQQEPGSTDAAYDPAVALKFFKSAGKPATIGEGETIFGEKERAIPLLRRQKMYLLVKGDVALVSNKKTIGRVRAGEIFGEMAVISDAPRSAAAVAKTECRVIALDDKEFEAALGKHPEFAVMLMSVMILRLRNTIAQLKSRDALSEDAQLKEARAFDPEVLSHLVEGLADDPPIFYQEGAKIVTEGQKGLRMYAIVEGKVRISIGGRVVERLGPGGAFGEAALVDATAMRIADATADTDTTVQAISKKAFLQLVKVSPEFGATMLSSLASRLRFLTARL